MSLLARTAPGEWILMRSLRLAGRYHDEKWAALQSRDAAGIDDAFLGWLSRRRRDRPFFAFLNYFDAHIPYMPPERFLGRFGMRPKTQSDYHMIMDYEGITKSELTARDIQMARDCYDDCVAYLDAQLGRLFTELDRQGLLADTDVIITSDHGEAFGEHQMVGHSNSVFVEETRVPLVIITPDMSAAELVFRPVSLRDLPATVVDQAGLSDGSPLPGRSLAACWKSPPERLPQDSTSPAFSEQVHRSVRGERRPQTRPGGDFPTYQMSVVSSNHHYIRDCDGDEFLYNLPDDPLEQFNLLAPGKRKPDVEPFRRLLLKVLTENPGTVEVERAYLKSFRQSLETLVRAGRAEPNVAALSDDPRGD
jgi:arylsulfatase A-like enzyme